MNNDKNRLPAGIFLVFIGIALSLVLVEMGLRLAGFVSLSVQRAGNELSMKKEGTCRIMCIGESTTSGQYPRWLEDSLNRKSGRIKFSVIDRGVGSTNSTILLRDLKDNLARYRPHIVVAMVGINDSQWNEVVKKDGFMEQMRVVKLFRLISMDLKAAAGSMRGRLVPYKDQASGKDIISGDTDVVYEKLDRDLKNGRDYGSIENELSAFLEKHPEKSEIYLELARLYFRELDKNKDKGFDCLREAEKYAAGSTETYCGIVELYSMVGEFDKAGRVADKYLLSGVSENVKCRVMLTLGRLYELQKKPVKALGCYKSAAGMRNGDSGRIYACIAEMLWMKEDKKNAEEYFIKALALDPHDNYLNGLIGTFYLDIGDKTLSDKYFKTYEGSRTPYCGFITQSNYNKIVGIVTSRGIKMICMEYPMRNITPLKEMIGPDAGVLFVDNEGIFKGAVLRYGYDAIFRDRFADVFGHCTDKGNELMAENLADKILERFFAKQG